ncbi:hypothetical protein AB6A40_002818 [Gnathostoma spinigerum]|uniref:F-box domain-containing protein n=1 Tax=Gnathostoma spinigerum TaxID=75299 RepID=A0ABD6E7N5_9BILA
MRLRSNRDISDPTSNVENERCHRKRKSAFPAKKQVAKKRTKRNRNSYEKVVEDGSESVSSDVPSTSKSVSSVVDGRKHAQSGKMVDSMRSQHIQRGDVATSHVKTIGDLPNHIMVEIFNFLPVMERIKIERVCRLWQYLSRNYSWSKTTVLNYSTLVHSFRPIDKRPIVSNTQVRSISRRCGKYLRSLDLHAFRDTLTYNVCSTFAPLCRDLTTLNLYGIQLTNSSLQLIGRHCPLLEDVNFHRCFQESVVERGLSSFFSKCQYLKAVDVGQNERLTGVPSFAFLPQSLVTLKIGGCYRINGGTMDYIKQRCSDLTTLVMSSVDTLSAGELNSLFEALKNLRKLKFGECFISHSSGGTELNFSTLKNLVELTINDNLLITDRALSSIVNGCKQIKYLDMSGCNRFVTPDGLMGLAKLPALTHLNLSLMRVTTDAILKKIAERGKLVSLLIHRCDHVTDKAIVYLLDHCKSLRNLDLSYCHRVTDVSMQKVINYVAERDQLENSGTRKTSPGLDDTCDAVFSRMNLYDRMRFLLDNELEYGRPLFDFHELETSWPPHIYFDELWDKRDRRSSDSDNLMRLNVWIGHSGITQPCESSHPLLRISCTEPFNDSDPSVLAFRIVVRLD